jgi:LemA protein
LLTSNITDKNGNSIREQYILCSFKIVAIDHRIRLTLFYLNLEEHMSFSILLLVIVALAIYVISIYNSLVTLKNRFKNSFSQIDVQLQRRYDLIPNLVETAKAYMAHEKGTLEAVIAARNQASAARAPAAANPADASAMQALNTAEAGLSGALTKFFALAESYPDLKANTTMNQLMEELSSTENKIAFSRQAYNDSATQYNTQCEVFPNNLVANNFGFTKAELLTLEQPEARQAPKVSF